MDDEKKIKIKEWCNCSFDISCRNVIEIGIRPVLQNITIII